MADLRPIGSEKLEGIDKLKRIMEIATYKETPKTDLNNLSTTDYTIQLTDGNFYGIVRERQGYIIKKGINESELDYSEPMKNRKYYRSYSEAMKKLNLIVAETSRMTGNDFEIPLIGEQPEAKKKFVLKTPKKAEPEMDAAPAEPAPSVEPPMDMASPAPDTTTPDMGMGDEPMGDTGMGDMGAEPMGDEPMGDMGAEPMDTEIEDVEIDTDEEGPSNLKLIQKLTGKLSQRLRMFEKDKGLDSQDIKYVMNSIISAIDLKKLDDDDREEIVDKLEGFDEYGKEGEGELDFGVEDEFDFGGEEPTDETGMDDMMGDTEITDTEMPVEPETKEGYQTVMDSIFGESQVEKVLSGYFQVEEKETPILENKNKMDFLKRKINKITQTEEVQRLSINETQKQVGLTLIEQYDNASFIGRTTKKNLVFKINNKEVKVTPQGRTI